MKTLVVDDDRDSLDLFEAVLSARGHEVSAHENAEAALADYAENHYPLVVLDWLMPGLDGLELCRRIRALPRGDRSNILVVTAKSEPDALEQVLAAGADDYLAKPFDVQLLNVRLAIAEEATRNLLDRKRSQDKLRDAMEQLQSSHDDMFHLLNELRLGTVIADEEGYITFLSRSARVLLGQTDAPTPSTPPSDGVVNVDDLPAAQCASLGTWQAAFPIDESDKKVIAEMATRPPNARVKVSANFSDDSGRQRSVEVEIKDDPRDPRRKLFCLYDVSDVHALRKQLDKTARFDDLVGRSKRMRDVYDLIRDVAHVDSTVMVLGETGTGKELVARAIHRASKRADQPMIPVNCAGLTESILTSQLFGHKKGAFTGADEDREGLFEAADGGTLFLDELGDIPMSVQTTLLRVLQEKEITRVGETRPRKIDVRVIAATHRDLNHEVATGNFRQDLLYRLRVVTVRLPPLRERREDIPLLCNSMLMELCAALGKQVEGVSHEGIRILMEHDWPGNVRELKSVLESSIIRCRRSVIQPEDLPSEVFDPVGRKPIVEEGTDEREAILSALRSTKGNRTAAAKLLGISRATFYRRLGLLDIDV